MQHDPVVETDAVAACGRHGLAHAICGGKQHSQPHSLHRKGAGEGEAITQRPHLQVPVDEGGLHPPSCQLTGRFMLADALIENAKNERATQLNTGNACIGLHSNSAPRARDFLLVSLRFQTTRCTYVGLGI